MGTLWEPTEFHYVSERTVTKLIPEWDISNKSKLYVLWFAFMLRTLSSGLVYANYSYPDT